MCLACLAKFGRCSLIFMPGTDVEISLDGPPLACPGLRSNVSVCAGPPFIHNKMQERLRSGSLAAATARRSNQPDEEQPSAPAADKRNHSRRDSCNEDRAMVVSFEELATSGQDAG